MFDVIGSDNQQDKNTIQSDVTFGSVQLEIKKKDKGVLDYQYRAILYVIDHVNDLAYPVLSYVRPNIPAVIKADRLDDYKKDMRSALECFEQTRHFMQMHMDGCFNQNKEVMSHDDYNARLNGFLDLLYKHVEENVMPVVDGQSDDLLKFYAYTEAYPIRKSEMRELNMFLKRELREKYREERQREVLKRNQKSSEQRP